jgi:TonB family protein
MKFLASLTLASLLFSFYSNAIIMRHDINPEKYQVDQAQYPSVIDLNFLTGTLITPQWILTAAHGTLYMPGNQEVIINKQKYYVEFIIEHPKYNKDNLNHDMALLKLNRPVLDVVPTDIYTLADEKNQHVWFVGRGDIGNGKIGVTGASEVLNHAENMVENADGLWITFDFDSAKTNALGLEGISGPVDSGGPAFIETPAGLKVGGVSSHQRDNNNGEGLYGVQEYYTRTSAHKKWIENIKEKEDSQLSELALNRPTYQIIKAKKNEKEKLKGRYELIDGTKFFIESCRKGICYRWENSPHQTRLYKTTNERWFTPKIKRILKPVFSNNGMIKHLVMDDFHGQRHLTKHRGEQVLALKKRINKNGRELLTHVEPIWPKKAIEKKVEGSVTMSFSINTNGSVDSIKVLEATPIGMFEGVSIKALSQWKYAELNKSLTEIKTKFDFTL